MSWRTVLMFIAGVLAGEYQVGRLMPGFQAGRWPKSVNACQITPAGALACRPAGDSLMAGTKVLAGPAQRPCRGADRRTKN